MWKVPFPQGEGSANQECGDAKKTKHVTVLTSAAPTLDLSVEDFSLLKVRHSDPTSMTLYPHPHRIKIYILNYTHVVLINNPLLGDLCFVRQSLYYLSLFYGQLNTMSAAHLSPTTRPHSGHTISPAW